MNIRLQNQLNMVGACIEIVYSSNYKPVWEGKEPTDFAADMATLKTDYDAVKARAALAAGATGGAADMKSLAESALEDTAYVLTRALANHFKKKGDLDSLAKVDLSKTEIVKLRAQELVDKTTVIRDLGTAALADVGAAGRGVKPERVTALSDAITKFSGVMNTPRGQIVNRSTLLRELETETAALMQRVADLDDLVLQFDGGELGARFKEAWKRARIIVDTGTGHSNGDAPVATAAPAVAVVK
jgi:hypothetical protein